MLNPVRLVLTLALGASFGANLDPSWSPFTLLQYEPIYGFYARGDTMWAAVGGGVKRSYDQGAHWSEPGAGMSGRDVKNMIHTGKRLLAGQGRTLYASEDGGRTWMARDSIETGSFMRFVARGDTLYAYHELYGKAPPEGALISRDGGLTWQEVPGAGMLESEPIVFRGDTVSFSGQALLRKSRGVWETLLSLSGTISQAIAVNERLIVCSSGICAASADGRGGWAVFKTGYAPVTVSTFNYREAQNLAVDSAYVAMQTSNAIYLSRNRGRDWALLAWNIFDISVRLTLADGWLYVTARENRWAHRYSIADAAWDSVPLPGSSRVSGFGAGSGMVAFASSDSGYAVFISTDHGSHFRKTGTLASNIMDATSLMTIARSRIYLSGYDGLRSSEDSGRTWATMLTPCQKNPKGLMILDSGIFLSYPTSLWRMDSAAACDWQDVPLPPSLSSETLPVMAGSGGALLISSSKGAWIWEPSSPTTRITRAISPRSSARTVSASLPVRSWRRPGTRDGVGIDALGQRRPYPAR